MHMLRSCQNIVHFRSGRPIRNYVKNRGYFGCQSNYLLDYLCMHSCIGNTSFLFRKETGNDKTGKGWKQKYRKVSRFLQNNLGNMQKRCNLKTVGKMT